MTVGLLLNSRHRFEKPRIQEWNQESFFVTLDFYTSVPQEQTVTLQEIVGEKRLPGTETGTLSGCGYTFEMVRGRSLLFESEGLKQELKA